MKEAASFYIETLGCPKNQVDSEKLSAFLLAKGLVKSRLNSADYVIVNTCGFIEDAKEESINKILELSDSKRKGAKLVVTGCLAQRYPDELANEIKEIDLVSGIGVNFLEQEKNKQRVAIKAYSNEFDLLNILSRPSRRSYSYVKIAEGCDRSCTFCAIPSFKGRQVSRPIESIVEEAASKFSKEIILVAQDPLRYGIDLGERKGLISLLNELKSLEKILRILYLYPASLTDEIIETIYSSCVPYFDLSFQHVSKKLLRRMNRPGSYETYSKLVKKLRELNSDVAIRASFIVGFPSEDEDDQECLVNFLKENELDWVGFFKYSDEENTPAYNLKAKVDPSLINDRLAELTEIQDSITLRKRDSNVGKKLQIIADSPLAGRSYMEAPDIDALVKVNSRLKVNNVYTVKILSCTGIDLIAEVI